MRTERTKLMGHQFWKPSSLKECIIIAYCSIDWLSSDPMQLFQLEEEMRGKYFSDEINQEFLRRNDFPIIFSRHVARGFSVSASPSPLTLVWLTLLCRANIKTDLWFPRIAIYAPMIYTDFDVGSIHYEGKWEMAEPWKSRLFWAQWNGIEPIGCFMYKSPRVTLRDT